MTYLSRRLREERRAQIAKELEERLFYLSSDKFNRLMEDLRCTDYVGDYDEDQSR